MARLDDDAKDALLKGLPIAVAVYHAPTARPADMRLVMANDAMDALVGAPLSRGVGRTVGELFANAVTDPDSIERLRMIHRVAVGGTADVIGPIDSSDPRLGGFYRMSLRGLPGRRVAVFFEDVTGAVEQAEQLRIWSGLARSVPVAIVVAGAAGGLTAPIVAHNPMAERLMGIVDDGGTLDDALARWLPDELRADLLDHLAAGQPFEWYCARAELVYRMRVNRAGDHVMLSATDDTEGDRLRAALERHAELLARSNDELEAFAHIVSHDLQAPMRSMASFSVLLERRYADRLDDRGLRYLGHITEGARRMQALVRDVLSWSRVGRGESAPARVELAAVVTRAVENLQARIDETGGVVEYDGLPAVWGVEPQLVRLVQNLIENGLKYHRSGARPWIGLSATASPTGWRILVEDDGVGVPEDKRDEVFEPLRRLGAHDAEGSGLGLAICRRIVQRCHGRIHIEGRDGPGTRVVVDLPRPADFP